MSSQKDILLGGCLLSYPPAPCEPKACEGRLQTIHSEASICKHLLANAAVLGDHPQDLCLSVCLTFFGVRRMGKHSSCPWHDSGEGHKGPAEPSRQGQSLTAYGASFIMQSTGDTSLEAFLAMAVTRQSTGQYHVLAQTGWVSSRLGLCALPPPIPTFLTQHSCIEK